MTCRYRSSFAGAALILAASMLQTAHAAELPPVKATASNAVAECATPGRLMAFLRDNNSALNPKFNSVASEYMRHGEALGLRWDYAFFQMLLETGYLKFTGDVKADQNNFAGLGATGKGARGESFKDVSTGVRAHIEHLLMYSGARVENPVAERTRNVQEWGVLVPWQKSIGQPITFAQLAKQWAPTSRRYSVDMQSIADRFFAGPCLGEDPEPQLVADVRGGAGGKAKSKDKAKTAEAKPQDKTPAVAKETAKEVAERAIDEQRKDAAAAKSALGAQDVEAGSEAAVASVAEAAPTETRTVADFAPQKAQPPVKILNAASEADAEQPEKAAAAVAAEPGKEKPAKAPETKSTETKAAETKAAETKTADTKASAKVEKSEAAAKVDQKSTKVAAVGNAQAGAATAKAEKKPAAAPSAPSGKCRVWTASYGGAKAIIIKAVVDKTTNYTVLDVNEGAERREADAYIDAYAKGGEKVGEFSSQPQALEKAFELCPEG